VRARSIYDCRKGYGMHEIQTRVYRENVVARLWGRRGAVRFGGESVDYLLRRRLLATLRKPLFCMTGIRERNLSYEGTLQIQGS